MNRRIKVGTIFAVSLLFCTPLVPERGHPADYSDCGMKRVASRGKSFLQGWNSPEAQYDERPGMAVRFTYDYWLDSTEVTQGEYFAVTGRRPVPENSPYGVGDAYPVYHVSWFDAVLYCNGRSRQEGLDTVYSYSGAKSLPNGSVYELTGIGYDLSKDGYRLPTESEWEYGARGSRSALSYTSVSDSVYASYYAWYGKNSGNLTHPVGTRLPNGYGLYDMGGNVFEWTNDWKGVYRGEAITNSLGFLEPGNEYEKVIKGGSYNYSLMYLRPSCRSATYATMLSSANGYVGFRCARGVIAKGEYIGHESSFTPHEVTIVSDRSGLRSFLGTSETKLVFVNITGSYRTLCYVDFGSMFPYVVEYVDERDVYHPAISPDGRYVAYCSRSEGQCGPSKIRVRSLDSLGSPIVELPSDTAYIPRWWVHPLTGDTCIVYTNSAIDNENTFLWGMSGTYCQKMRGGTPEGTSDVLIGNGGYHDGVSADVRYAVTGYRRLLRRDMTRGVDTQLFVPPDNGKDGEGSVQVCNVSISPDTGSNVRCMFLDFGYLRTSSITGCSYGVHEYLFVSDMEGQITDYLRCPEVDQSWDGIEWSNQPRFAVGCGRNTANQAHAVYAIDLHGKKYKQLVEGTELQQPCMICGSEWSSIYNLDSLGYYHEPLVYEDQKVFAQKLHLFWRYHEQLELIFIGNSETYCNVDCGSFKNYKALNMGFSGCGIYATSQIMLNYLFIHAPKLQLVGVNIPFGFFSIPSGDCDPTFYDSCITFSKGYHYDRDHGFWKDSISTTFYEVIISQPFPPIEGSLWDSLGLFHFLCNGWGGPDPDITYPLNWTVDNPTYQENLIAFENLIKECSLHDIHFLAVNMPQSPYYKETDHYYREGPSWETARTVLAQLDSLENIHPNFHIYDAYQYGNHDYTDEDAKDYNHLCPHGAAKLALRLEPLIDSILKK